MRSHVPLVYLAGPITGLSYDASTDWRVKVRHALLPDIEALSPMRDKAWLEGRATLGDGYHGDVLCSDDAIFARDCADVARADLLLINLLGATVPSGGTWFETGYSCGLFGTTKPRIVVMEPSGNPHEHAFMRKAASVRVDNLPEAVEVVRSFLLPG